MIIQSQEMSIDTIERLNMRLTDISNKIYCELGISYARDLRANKVAESSSISQLNFDFTIHNIANCGVLQEQGQLSMLRYKIHGTLS